MSAMLDLAKGLVSVAMARNGRKDERDDRAVHNCLMAIGSLIELEERMQEHSKVSE